MHEYLFTTENTLYYLNIVEVESSIFICEGVYTVLCSIRPWKRSTTNKHHGAPYEITDSSIRLRA